jgi:hypothetical protein
MKSDTKRSLVIGAAAVLGGLGASVIITEVSAVVDEPVLYRQLRVEDCSENHPGDPECPACAVPE